MPTALRRLSLDQAKQAAEALAVSYAAMNRIEGELLSVEPDELETEKQGKTPVHWAAVFEHAHKGAAFDGPMVVRINLESETVTPLDSP